MRCKHPPVRRRVLHRRAHEDRSQLGRREHSRREQGRDACHLGAGHRRARHDAVAAGGVIGIRWIGAERRDDLDPGGYEIGLDHVRVWVWSARAPVGHPVLPHAVDRDLGCRQRGHVSGSGREPRDEWGGILNGQSDRRNTEDVSRVELRFRVADQNDGAGAAAIVLLD